MPSARVDAPAPRGRGGAAFVGRTDSWTGPRSPEPTPPQALPAADVSDGSCARFRAALRVPAHASRWWVWTRRPRGFRRIKIRKHGPVSALYFVPRSAPNARHCFDPAMHVRNSGILAPDTTDRNARGAAGGVWPLSNLTMVVCVPISNFQRQLKHICHCI